MGRRSVVSQAVAGATELLLDNPIITKEVRETLATRRALILFAVFTGVIAGTVHLAWPRGSQLLGNIDLIARRLFEIVGLTLIVLVSAVAPAFSAVAITGEKERRTFDLLITSGIGEARVLVGKLVGSLLYLSLLLAATVPMVSLCLLLGGIGPQDILALYLLLFEVAVVLVLVGLACSCLFSRNNAALGSTYIVALPALGLLLLNVAEVRHLPLVWLVVALFYLGGGTVIALALLSIRIRRPTEFRPPEEEEEEGFDAAVGLVLNRSLVPDRWLAPPPRVDLLEDGRNPVLSKEIHSEILGQGTVMLRVIIQIGLIVAVFPFTALYLVGLPAWYFTYFSAFALVIGPAFTAGMLTSEHENRTFSLLATTQLRPREIVIGKFAAGVRLTGVLLAILVAPTLPALVFSQFRDQILPAPAVLALFALCAAWATALVALSLAWSLVSRRTTGALVGSYLTGGIILAGPLVVHAVIVSFTSLPTAWASAGLGLSPLTHFFALGTPGSVRPPVWVNPEASWLGWALCFGLLTAFTVLTLKLMTVWCDRTWRRRAES